MLKNDSRWITALHTINSHSGWHHSIQIHSNISRKSDHHNYRVDQIMGLLLKRCNFCIWWCRKAVYVSNCLVMHDSNFEIIWHVAANSCIDCTDVAGIPSIWHTMAAAEGYILAFSCHHCSMSTSTRVMKH